MHSAYILRILSSKSILRTIFRVKFLSYNGSSKTQAAAYPEPSGSAEKCRQSREEENH